MPLVFASQTNPDGPLYFSEDILIWYGLALLIFLDDLWLLVNVSSKILLRPPLALSSLLYEATHIHCHLLMLQLLSLAVQLGRVKGGSVLLVCGRPFRAGFYLQATSPGLVDSLLTFQLRRFLRLLP